MVQSSTPVLITHRVLATNKINTSLRTDCGAKVFIYTKLVEVLPMVMDFLTISSFAVLLCYKILSYVSSVCGDGMKLEFFKPSHERLKKPQ